MRFYLLFFFLLNIQQSVTDFVSTCHFVQFLCRLQSAVRCHSGQHAPLFTTVLQYIMQYNKYIRQHVATASSAAISDSIYLYSCLTLHVLSNLVICTYTDSIEPPNKFHSTKKAGKCAIFQLCKSSGSHSYPCWCYCYFVSSLATANWQLLVVYSKCLQ